MATPLKKQTPPSVAVVAEIKKGEKMKEPIIDPELQALISPLSIDEYNQLEANILKDGIRDPIVLWNNILIDGHNRYAIAKKHNLGFEKSEHQFESKDDVKVWIIKNQLGRRNLSSATKIELALALEPLIRAQANKNYKENVGRPPKKSCQKSDTIKIDTKKEVAKLAGVSYDTVKKYKEIKSKASPELMTKVMSGEKKIGTAYQEIQPSKVCNVCGKEKPATKFPSNGVNSCRVCFNAKVRENGKEKRDNENKKICRECGVEKSVDDFYFGKSNCKSCHNQKRVYRDVKGNAIMSTPEVDALFKEHGAEIHASIVDPNRTFEYTIDDLAEEVKCIVNYFNRNIPNCLEPNKRLLNTGENKKKIIAVLMEAEAAIKKTRKDYLL